MILFCEVNLLREIVATEAMAREDLIREILEAFPQSNLKRVYNNGWDERMTLMFKSHGTGKEIALFCKLMGFWCKPKKLKMKLVRWLYKNGYSTFDANIIADEFVPDVKKAYSTTPVETEYTGPFAKLPVTIEREVVQSQLGYDADRKQLSNPMEAANEQNQSH